MFDRLELGLVHEYSIDLLNAGDKFLASRLGDQASEYQAKKKPT